MIKTQDAFNQLQTQNVVTWTTLISGYVRHGHGEEALTYYKRMQNEGFSPNAFTFVSILKACGIGRNICRGKETHSKIVKEGFLQKDILVATALMDMYCKCSELTSAREVFDGFPIRDVVIWTALIAGYVENKHVEEAFDGFNRIECEGLCANAFTMSCTLKACGSIRAIDKGKRIHMRMIEDRHIYNGTLVANALMDMYVKSGSLAKTQQVFDELLARDIVSWNVLISGYSHHGNGDEALHCFYQMQEECHLPNSVTFLCTLKACNCIESVEKGKQIHVQVVEQRLLERDVLVGNALVDMYAKCGVLAKAEEMFDQLPIRNVMTWNTLITGYSQHGHGEEALNCFQWMKYEGLSPDAVTFLCILKACGCLGLGDIGKEIHDQISKEGMHVKYDLISNALIDMYAKCGALAKAKEVFDGLQARSVISWTALISGYAEHGYSQEALDCFEQMQYDGLRPNFITYLCILKACGSLGAIEKGKEIHSWISTEGLLGKDNLVENALLDMYAKCGALRKAQEVFYGLQTPDVFSWNTLLIAYLQHGYDEEVFCCFELMKHNGIRADMVTFISVLRACGNIGGVRKGQGLHAEIVMMGLPENVIGSSLVDMYARCGALDEAHKITDGLQVCDAFSLTALISGYVEHGHCEEALNCFEKLRGNGFIPDVSTFICILKACGNIGATEKAQILHAEIERMGLLEENVLIGTSLVDMYAKCGAIEKAQEVFNNLPVRDIICWTALIAGYAQLGKDVMAIDLFSKMVIEGIDPNPIVFTVLLNACSHSGLIEEGQTFFETMRSVYGIMPNLEHYLCMIDVFVRSGLFHKALLIIEKLPILDARAVWTVLLGACQKWGNLKLAGLAFENALQQSDENCTSIFVCMRNICAATAI